MPTGSGTYKNYLKAYDDNGNLKENFSITIDGKKMPLLSKKGFPMDKTTKNGSVRYNFIMASPENRKLYLQDVSKKGAGKYPPPKVKPDPKGTIEKPIAPATKGKPPIRKIKPRRIQHAPPKEVGATFKRREKKGKLVKTKYVKGGKLKGKSHAKGGIPIEAEGGEFIVKKTSTNGNEKLLHDINDDGKMNNSYQTGGEIEEDRGGKEKLEDLLKMPQMRKGGRVRGRGRGRGRGRKMLGRRERRRGNKYQEGGEVFEERPTTEPSTRRLAGRPGSILPFGGWLHMYTLGMPLKEYDIYPDFKFLLKNVRKINNNIVKKELKKRRKKKVKGRDEVWKETLKILKNNHLKREGMTLDKLVYKQGATLKNLEEQLLQLKSIARTHYLDKKFKDEVEKDVKKKQEPKDYKHIGVLIDLESLLGQKIDVERLKNIFLQQGITAGDITGGGSGTGGEASNEQRKNTILTNDLSSVPADKREGVNFDISRLRRGGLGDAQEKSLLKSIEMNIPDIIKTKPKMADLKDLDKKIDIGDKPEEPAVEEKKVELLRYAGNDHLRRSTFNFDYNVNKKSDEFVGKSMFRTKVKNKIEIKRLRF